MTTAGSTSTGRSVTTAGSRSPAASSPTVRLVGGDVAVEGLPRADRTYRWCGPDHDITLAPLPHSSPGGAPLWAVRIVADVAALGTTPPSRGVLETVFHRFTGWTQVRYADATCLFAYDLTPGVVDRMRDGRVFVAGDAAHAHTLPAPHASAGLAAGLRDATNLSWKLAAVLRGAGEDLLDSYEAERLPAALRTNQLSADPVRELLGDVTGWPAALLGARRSPRRSARRGASRSPRRGAGGMLRSLPPPAARLVLRRRAARDARRRDPDLHYRDSRLSQELGGRRLFLHAGDPVPDVRLWSPDRAADVRLSDVRLSEARAQSQVTQWTVLGLGSVTTEVVRAALHRFGPAVRGEVIGGGLGTARGVTLLDRYGEARRLLGRQGGSVLVVRPDGHLGLRCGLNPDILLAYLDDLVGSPAEVTG